MNELLQYIESSEGNGNGNGKKASEKKNGAKNNATLSKESTTKLKQKEKKSSSKLVRQTDASMRHGGDSDDSDAAGEVSSPPSLAEGSLHRPVTETAESELETTLAASAADFQTVTKKQKRKKRNSLSNSMTNGKKESLFDQTNMNLFYNASSPSVMMRHQPRHHNNVNSVGGGSSSSTVAGEMKKLVVSMPPSEPSDVDSDGGDSVHSLPIQPSAPLFPSTAPTAAATAAAAEVSYADIIRCEHNNVKSEVTFLAESSQPVDIKNLLMPSAASPVAEVTVPAPAPAPALALAPEAADVLIPAAAKLPAAAAAYVPSNKLKSKAKLTGPSSNHDNHLFNPIQSLEIELWIESIWKLLENWTGMVPSNPASWEDN